MSRNRYKGRRKARRKRFNFWLCFWGVTISMSGYIGFLLSHSDLFSQR